MPTLFVSHSSRDTDLAAKFVNLLEKGAGIPRNQIFFSPDRNAIRPGDDFLAKIRKALQTTDCFVPILSENYQNSHFCMFELGSFWASPKRRNIFPVLVPPIDHLDMDPIIDHLQAIRLDSPSDIKALRERLGSELCLKPTTDVKWHRQSEVFLKGIKSLVGDSEIWIYALKGKVTHDKVEEDINTVGCFKVDRIRNTSNEVRASGEVYWVDRNRLTQRGTWDSIVAVRQKHGLLILYHLIPHPGDKHHPPEHDGLIRLEPSGEEPRYGDSYQKGSVKDVGPYWGGHYAQIYAERMRGKNWNEVVTFVRDRGLNIFKQFTARAVGWRTH